MTETETIREVNGRREEKRHVRTSNLQQIKHCNLTCFSLPQKGISNAAAKIFQVKSKS